MRATNNRKLLNLDKQMTIYTLDEMKNKSIGTVGTSSRDKFECELQMDLIDKTIKQTRQERNLTQEELNKLIGV